MDKRKRQITSLLTGLIVAVMMSPAARAQDSTDSPAPACEIMILNPVLKDGVPTGAKVPEFAPGDDFINSVYDGAEGFVREVNGHKIRGVFCTRPDVIPSLRDIPLLMTGVPLSISDDFDAQDSQLLTLYFLDGDFSHKYLGTPLNETQAAALEDFMTTLNLQPNKPGAQ